MKKYLGMIMLLLTALTVSDPALAGLNSSDSTCFFEQDARHFAEIGLGIITAPLGFDGPDWQRLGMIVGGTAILFLADKDMRAMALRNQNSRNDFLFNIDNYYGNGYSLLLTTGIYGYGALFGDMAIRRAGLHATEAFVYSVAVTGVLKVLIGRRRPYAGDSPLFFSPFRPTENTWLSLPSGHTTAGFAVSAALAKSLDNTYWKIFWYGSAGLVGAARIYHNKHWLSDVFLGAVIGYTVGDYVANFESKKNLKIFGARIQPWLGMNSIGLRVNLN